VSFSTIICHLLYGIFQVNYESTKKIAKLLSNIAFSK
jgi:hypothetical protein